MKITDEQLDEVIKEKDLMKVAACFDNIETYIHNLELKPGQQTDIRDLAMSRGTQIAMKEALRLWSQPNPFVATYEALLNIVLELERGDVAVRICEFISSKN